MGKAKKFSPVTKTAMRENISFSFIMIFNSKNISHGREYFSLILLFLISFLCFCNYLISPILCLKIKSIKKTFHFFSLEHKGLLAFQGVNVFLFTLLSSNSSPALEVRQDFYIKSHKLYNQ